jgi:hypothetical protein
VKSRYVYYPATAKRIGRRMTIMDRIRRRLAKRDTPDIYPIVDYWPPVYPTKK